MNRAIVPEPIRQVLDSFRHLASNPPLYRASVDALNFAVMEIAAEVGPCPSCGADSGVKPNRFPLKVESERGSEYCAVCGEPAREFPVPVPVGMPSDFDPEDYRIRHAEARAYFCGLGESPMERDRR
jgi:hypothetical protein